jgi:hypothetical protein
MAALRPLHEELMRLVSALGEHTVSPKKGYLSPRRRKQFAMIQPSATGRIDVGLILPAAAVARGRLEPAGSWNALFTHRVRITGPADLDPELDQWLRDACSAAQ